MKGEKEKTQEKAIPAQSVAAKVDPDKSSDKDKKTGDGEKSPQKKSKKKRKSRSRERERGRRDRGRDRDRDRKKRRKRSKSRSRSRKRRKKRSSSGSGDRDRRRKKSRTPSPTPEEIKEKEKQQELMELTRDVRTVFVSQLQVKCTEKDVKRFFEKVGKVKVNDVQLICDKHTGRSKGFGYVELKALEDVPKALVLNGQPFRFRKGKLGFPVMIKASEAEKNFAHNAEKATAAAEDGTATGAVTLQVANLHPEITEEDLGKMFTPFTNFTKAQLQRDAANKPTGRALVYFSQADAANRAIQGLNGVAFAGQTLQVRIVQAGSAPAADTKETWKLDDDAGTSGMSMNSASRAQLMQKLAGASPARHPLWHPLHAPRSEPRRHRQQQRPARSSA